MACNSFFLVVDNLFFGVIIVVDGWGCIEEAICTDNPFPDHERASYETLVL
jgi:hypothetical protein